MWRQRYERGVPIAKIEKGEKTTRRGTRVTFKADSQIFAVSEMNYETLSQRLRELAFLNSGVHIEIRDMRTEKHHEFRYEGGIVSFVKDMNKNKTPLHDEPIFIHEEKDGEGLEIAVQWNDGYSDSIYTFTNTIKNADGGTHLVGFKAALTRTIIRYATNQGVLEKAKVSLEGDDVRECMIGAVAIRLKDPVFESQTKNKLGNTEIRSELVNTVREELLHFFNRNKDVAQKIVAKVYL